MFTTKEEALTAMQEVAATMELMLSYADEELSYAEEAELEKSIRLIERLHEELFGAVLQLKSSTDRYLNIEMRNYVALTISKARQAMREAEFYF